jgi:hypothetical protein
VKGDRHERERKKPFVVEVTLVATRKLDLEVGIHLERVRNVEGGGRDKWRRIVKRVLEQLRLNLPQRVRGCRTRDVRQTTSGAFIVLPRDGPRFEAGILRQKSQKHSTRGTVSLLCYD